MKLKEQALKFLPKNWQQYIGFFIMLAATWLAAKFGFDTNKPLPPLPIWEPTSNDFGWISDPDAVKEIEKELNFKFFSDTPAGQSPDRIPRSVYLWHAHKKIHGVNPPCKNQNPVGSCVSFGTNNAVARTMAVQIAFMGRAEEYKDLCEEVTYAGSRVEVGKGRLGRSDGSVGAWAAKFVKEWGVVSREVHGKHDLTKYDPSRCRSWGTAGVPPELEELARQHPVQEITQIKTWAEAKRALANGYGIAVCSNYGFDMKRDARGISKPRGNWAHCMCLDGYHTDDDGQEYGHIENSWGDKAHTGPVGWGDPSPAGFWTSSKVIEGMLRSGDCWAFSAVKGFPARKIDWFVMAPPKAPPSLYAQLMRPAGESNATPEYARGLLGDLRDLPLLRPLCQVQ